MIKTFVLRGAPQLDSFVRWLSGVPKGKVLEVTVREHEDVRSVEQNSRYWALLSLVAHNVTVPKVDEGTGEILSQRKFTREVWHDYFAMMFLIPHEEVYPDGTTQLVRARTSQLSRREFADYMTKVEAWAAERGVTFEEVFSG